MSKKPIIYLVAALFEMLLLVYAIYMNRTIDVVVIDAVAMICFIIRAILEVRK